MQIFFVDEGAVYLLGYDYASILDIIEKNKEKHSLSGLSSILGDTLRIQILNLLLQRKEVTCKELEKLLGLSGSTAYHHLSLFTKLGALSIRNEGKTIYYSLNKKYFDIMREELRIFSND